jgi:hypothetical protein
LNENQQSSANNENPPQLNRAAATRNTAKMSLTNCRFYEEKFPEIDSFVMVNVKQVDLLSAAAW